MEHNMKKLVVSFSVLCLSSSLLAAGYGKAGCGLGSILAGKEGNQVIAATTNGTSGNQTFGISSGTSNCVPGASKSAAVQTFIKNNYTPLQNDIAKGNGESLVSLGSLLGCTNHHLLNQNFRKITQIFQHLP
jgi:hypothetical protein